MTDPTSIDADVIRHARVVPLDVVQAKGSGHAGTASSLTPLLYTLFQEQLRHDPADPAWLGRDRFVLSAGHASLALYLQLWLSGYGLELDDLYAARKLGSQTPGHPEFGQTPGVETTTGPLGQGIGNAVGIAMESMRLRRVLGTSLYSGRTWCVAGDGDLEEGISHEAASLAGTLSLEGLIVIWDDNRITIEGDTAITFAEDVTARFSAYGWHTLEIADAEDTARIREVLSEAADVTDAPVFIRLRSRIGHPMPNVGGTAGAHSGAPGVDEVRATKQLLGLDPDAPAGMPERLLEHARAVGERGARAHAEWDVAERVWRAEYPEQAAIADGMRRRDVGAQSEALATLRAAPKEVATRAANQAILNQLMPALPWLWGGSADLAESNGTAVPVESFLPPGVATADWSGGPGGQLVHFGIREHAMGAILNGMALSGWTMPFGATFFVFSDYMRPAMRLAALMKLPVRYVLSHDSIAVGEDGPTHQPVEQLWAVRGIPGLALARPADWVETVDVWRRCLEQPEGPVAIVLSRQALPVVAGAVRAGDGAVRGAYVVRDAVDPEAIIIATGSEVALAIAASETLSAAGRRVRVVSAPCLEWFEAQDADYRESVLPAAVARRVSVEAGTALGWFRYVGTSGRTVSVEDFGESGSGSQLLTQRGITADAVVSAVQSLF